MSRTARITGAILLAAVIALLVGGWRLYDAATKPSPMTLAEQLITALNERQPARAVEFINRGADVNGKERGSGRTCLMAAAETADSTVLQRLLQRGANVDATDNMGFTALDHLFTGGRPTPALVEMLLPKSGHLRQHSPNGVSPIANAANTRDAEVVRILLDAGANPNDKGNDGLPLLVSAVAADNLAMAKALLAHGANANTKDQTDKSVLQTAEDLTDDSLAQLLIAHGADVNAPDAKGNTPLISAVANNLPGTFADLLKKGAKINAQNKGRETALIVAVREGRREMVAALLERHADLTLQDATTRTALAWAKEQGFADIERDLKQYGARR